MEFSKRLDLLGDEVFAALNVRRRELEAEGRTVYDLSVGTPDFKPSQHVIDALVKSAQDPANWKYSLHDKDELLDAGFRRAAGKHPARPHGAARPLGPG